MAAPEPQAGSWRRRIAWLALIWAASVATLALIAYVLRLVMNAAGMTA